MPSARSPNLIGLFLVAVLAGQTTSSAQDLADAIAEDYATELKSLFEHFHRNPELSFLEHKTAARLAAELPEVRGRSHGGDGPDRDRRHD